MKKIISILCVSLLVSCSTFTNNDKTSYNKVDEVMEIVKSSYLDKRKDEELIDGAVEGIVASLDDPFSDYFTPEEAKSFYESLDATYEGIGARFTTNTGDFIITQVIENSPAQKAGLAKNDIIYKVDNVEVRGITSDQLVTKIKGKKGTVVKIGVLRGNDELEFDVTRDTVENKVLDYEIKSVNGQEIGYIKMSAFAESSAKEFKEAVASFEKTNVKEVLIDVRDNGGGYLVAVQDILEETLPKDVKMYGLQNRENETFIKVKNGKKNDIKFSVVINENSASASELLAGSFRDNGYDVYGTKSFGKGTVQTSFTLKDKSILKLTIQQWLTPNGEWIHKKGVLPTIEILQNDLYKQTLLKVEEANYDQVSENIKTMQLCLNSLGFSTRKDGYFDQATLEALKVFQSQNNVETTGILNEETIRIMNLKMYDLVSNPNSDTQLIATLEEMQKKQ